MNLFKKLTTIISLITITSITLTGCGVSSSSGFDTSKPINVVSREDGSGTRGAFVELFEIIEKDADGNKKDMTTKEAVIASKTDVLLTNVANDNYAVGYVSMGSLGDTIKAVDVDGVKATVENVKNGTYKASRPFNIALNGEATGVEKDFIDFILSAEGQAVVAKSYIAVSENAPVFKSAMPSGKITVAGSSSVSPIMEKLKEAYTAINKGATIEIQATDSTAGVNGAIDGTCQIGMTSRSLKESEKEQLTEIQIALDGIAVIVNKQNTATNITSAQIKDIYTGKITKWNEIVK